MTRACHLLRLVALALLVAACTPLERATEVAATATPPHAWEVRLEQHADGSWYAAPADRIPLVRVLRIVDGDTLIVEAADGRSERVRVFGIEAPEPAERCGTEATSDLKREAGAEVRLLADERLQDRFRRELRYVFTVDGKSVDAELIRLGAARAWEDDGTFRDILVGIEAEARLGARGCLWQP